MYSELNKVQLIGEVASMPEISGKDGNYFITMTLRMNHYEPGVAEEMQQEQSHRLVFSNKSAMKVRGLQEGELVYVEGALKSNAWADEKGNIHQSCHILVENLKALTQYSAPLRMVG